MSVESTWAAVLASVVTVLSIALSTVLLLRLQGARRTLAFGATREAELAQGDQMLRSVLDASPLAVLLLEDTGRIAYENAGARELFFEGRSCQGQNFLQLAAGGPEAIASAVLGANDEIVGLTVDGQRETYHFARRGLEYCGQPHTLLLVRPMTREVARHDVEALKKLVRLISHEVNNSLGPISSLVHTARMVQASGERLERLERVFDAVEERARHLANFIAGYASLARLPAPVPCEVPWDGLLSRLALLYPEASLRSTENARGYFDPAQLEQALINLLKNGHEAGGPFQAVALEVRSLPNEGSEIVVVDRGRGFTAESLEHALMPFYTTKPGGTGVGLALVREVVSAHGGQLVLGAREGGGAWVRVSLPGRSPRAELENSARLTLTRG
jgi:two-component system, NtrC family, nitrogen regulation sensor histidine kinase NtrY